MVDKCRSWFRQFRRKLMDLLNNYREIAGLLGLFAISQGNVLMIALIVTAYVVVEFRRCQRDEYVARLEHSTDSSDSRVSRRKKNR